MRVVLVAVSILAAAALIGCGTSDVVSVNPDAFDAIQPGMTRSTVKAYLGMPTDESLNAMHWEAGPWRDAWVLFNASGDNVTSKYWADDNTLRLADVPAAR